MGPFPSKGKAGMGSFSFSFLIRNHNSFSALPFSFIDLLATLAVVIKSPTGTYIDRLASRSYPYSRPTRSCD
jgi:hypothetical protein